MSLVLCLFGKAAWDGFKQHQGCPYQKPRKPTIQQTNNPTIKPRKPAVQQPPHRLIRECSDSFGLFLASAAKLAVSALLMPRLRWEVCNPRIHPSGLSVCN